MKDAKKKQMLSKLRAAERALYLINLNNPEGDDAELIHEVRGILSEVMESLDETE